MAVTLSRVQQMLAFGLLLLCGFLRIDTFVGVPHKSYVMKADAATTYHLIKCENKQPIKIYVLYCAEVIVLLTGARICWNTKEVPDAVNDSKYIAMRKRCNMNLLPTNLETSPSYNLIIFFPSIFRSFLLYVQLHFQCSFTPTVLITIMAIGFVVLSAPYSIPLDQNVSFTFAGQI